MRATKHKKKGTLQTFIQYKNYQKFLHRLWYLLQFIVTNLPSPQFEIETAGNRVEKWLSKEKNRRTSGRKLFFDLFFQVDPNWEIVERLWNPSQNPLCCFSSAHFKLDTLQVLAWEPDESLKTNADSIRLEQLSQKSL